MCVAVDVLFRCIVLIFSLQLVLFSLSGSEIDRSSMTCNFVRLYIEYWFSNVTSWSISRKLGNCRLSSFRCVVYVSSRTRPSHLTNTNKFLPYTKNNNVFSVWQVSCFDICGNNIRPLRSNTILAQQLEKVKLSCYTLIKWSYKTMETFLRIQRESATERLRELVEIFKDRICIER